MSDLSRLRSDRTLGIGAQDARIASKTAVFTVDRREADPIGVLVEYGPPGEIFIHPKDARTEE